MYYIITQMLHLQLGLNHVPIYSLSFGIDVRILHWEEVDSICHQTLKLSNFWHHLFAGFFSKIASRLLLKFKSLHESIFNEVSRQPFEVIDIMTIPKVAIWRRSAECMFWRATPSFKIFIEEVFILNLGLKQRNYFRQCPCLS